AEADAGTRKRSRSGDRHHHHGGVVLERLTPTVRHRPRDGHRRGSGRRILGLGKGASQSLDAEAAAALDATFGHAVGHQDESFTGLELALDGLKVRLEVLGAQRGVAWLLEFFDLAVDVDEKGGWMAAVHPHEGAG